MTHVFVAATVKTYPCKLHEYCIRRKSFFEVAHGEASFELTNTAAVSSDAVNQDPPSSGFAVRPWKCAERGIQVDMEDVTQV